MNIKPSKLLLLPPQINYSKLIKDISVAQQALGELNGSLSKLHNPSLLVTPLLTKEAVLSSKIEGTFATIEDVFEYEVGNEKTELTEPQKDIKEILNYRISLSEAMKKLENMPLCTRLIKELHKTLLNSVRGETKNPGNFRKQQVAIGTNFSGIKKIRYMPPEHKEISNLMSNLEKYIHSEEENFLVQLGIIHYQFEAIHPFNDGNGRIGRLLIPLFLFSNKLLSHPLLYISEYFENNRDEYGNLLHHIDTTNEWEPWLKFFLKAITTQSLKTQTTISKILALYDKLKSDIITINSFYAIQFLDTIFTHPTINFTLLKNKLHTKSVQTIYNLIDKFVTAGIIEEISGKDRDKVYNFTQLYTLLK
jgi:Fic family protein